MSDERRAAPLRGREQRTTPSLSLDIKLVLGVLARGHGLRVCGQEIAEVLVRQLASRPAPSCSPTGRRRARARGLLDAVAAAGWRGGDLDEAVAAARPLIGTGVEPRASAASRMALRRSRPAELADEGFLVLRSRSRRPAEHGLHSITAHPGLSPAATRSPSWPRSSARRSARPAARVGRTAVRQARDRARPQPSLSFARTRRPFARGAHRPADRRAQPLEPREDRVPRHGVARAAHAAQRDPRLRFPHARRRRRAVSDEHSSFLDRVLAARAPEHAHRRHPLLRAARGRPVLVRSSGLRTSSSWSRCWR